MNLNFGTEGYIVRYLQTFLKDNYSRELVVTGKFNQETQEALINYLHFPNTERLFNVKRELLQEFPDLSRLFYIGETNDTIEFTSKTIDKETADFITLFVDQISEFLESYGWKVDSYKDYVNWNYDINEDDAIDNVDSSLLSRYILDGTGLTEEQIARSDFNSDRTIDNRDLRMLNDYINNEKLKIIVSSSGRKNYFPNDEMLPMINQFTGRFSYFTAFRSNTKEGASDFIDKDPSGENKICVIKCKPSTKYTITHGSIDAEKLIIGCYTGKRSNMKTLKLRNVQEVTISPGNTYIYETVNNATFIVIQCNSEMGHLEEMEEKYIDIKLGDINFDGKVDQADRKILADYLFYPEGHNNRPVLNKKQLFAADINADGQITEEDMQMMNAYLNGTIPSLGINRYYYYIPKELKEKDKVAKLLVIEGDATKEIIGTEEIDGSVQQITRSKYGINFSSFAKDPWIIHDKFIPYLLGMAVHKYSRSEEITYVQDLLKEIYPTEADGFITGFYSPKMKELVKEYQMSKFTLTSGDFNGDGVISEDEEQMVRDYIDGEIQLTELQQEVADVNNDDKVDEADYQIIRNYRLGINDDLNTYTIPFYLGWLDPQTEALMINELNGIKTVNEVGWK